MGVDFSLGFRPQPQYETVVPPYEPHVERGYTKYVDIRIMRALVPKAVAILRQHDFDAIAFRGMSGAIIAPVLALELGKSIIMIRKPRSEESDHAYGDGAGGDKAARRYVIVDDFIDSGATVRAVVQGVGAFAPQAECLGVLCMHDVESMTAFGQHELTPVPEL